MQATAQSYRKAQFSAYEFDLRTGDLTRSGIRLRLESQPAKVLGLLIEAEGNLVSRSELIAALWPEEVEGNFDRRLDKAIAKLRASLNDDPTKPRYIETLKGRGYRFLEEITFPEADGGEEAHLSAGKLPRHVESVEAQSVADTPNGSLPQIVPVRPFLPKSHSIRWIAGAVALMATVALVWWLLGQALARPKDLNRPIVLLLDFREAGNHSEGDTWISEAAREWISANLNTAGEVQLVRAHESASLKPSETDTACGGLSRASLETARRAFNADMVVYGVYSATEDSASGDRWRLDVCLENTRDNKGPKSITVVGVKGDIAQLVSDAGEMLRSKLGLKQLSNQSLGYLRATLPSNPAAARLYIEGISSLDRFEPQEAVALLTQAKQLESRHAPTHAALSTAWDTLGYRQRSRQEALLALQLANELSPAQQLEYEGLGDEVRNDWSAAIDVYTKLLQRYPDNLDYGLRLAKAQTKDAKGQLALETLRSLRSKNSAALIDPRVDLAEAEADSAISDYRGQLDAATTAEKHAFDRDAGLLIAKARMEQGKAQDMLGDSTEALKLWRLAGQSFESIGDRGGMADTLNHQADLAWKKDDVVNATNLFEKSIKLSSAASDNIEEAYSLSRLGLVHMSAEAAPGGEMPLAVKMFRQAASIYHMIGNTAEEGAVFSLLGDEAIQRSKYEEARAFYLKGMALSRAAGDKSRIAGRLLDLGIVDEWEGHNQEAIEYFQQSSRAYEELGQKDRAAIARIRLGKSLFRTGKLEDAESMLESSLATMRLFGRTNQIREATGDLTQLEAVKNPAKAEGLAREGIRLEGESPRKNAYSPWYTQLAEIEMELGKLPEAKEAIHEAFLPGESSLPAEMLPKMLIERGEVRMADKDYGGAESDFSRALQMARKRGYVYQEIGARLGLAELHVRKRGIVAKPELDRLKRDADRLGYGVFGIKVDAFIGHSAPVGNRL